MQGIVALDAEILFIPKCTDECRLLLEEHELYSRQSVRSLQLDIFLLEEDLLSNELPDNFMHYMLGDDDAYKVTVMDSIKRIEMLSAPIKHKFVKGITSAKLFNTMRMEQTRSDIGPAQ
jgi:hypothetical protein